MTQEEMIANRRAPIGNAAVEVLMALDQGAIGLASYNYRKTTDLDRYIREPFSVTQFSSNFSYGSTLLSGAINLRIDDIIRSLLLRGYIEFCGREKFIEQTNFRDRLAKFGKKDKKNIASIFDSREGASYFFHPISPAGKQALLDMPTRVNKIREKQAVPAKYLITRNNQGMPGGFYRIDREQESKVFVFRENIPGIPKFEYDSAVKSSYRSNNNYNSTVSYIARKDILIADASIEVFKELLGVYTDYQSKREESERLEKQRVTEIVTSFDNYRTELRENTDQKLSAITNRVIAEQKKHEQEQSEGFVMDVMADDLDDLDGSPQIKI